MQNLEDNRHNKNITFTKLKHLNKKTRYNIICYIITVFDWKNTRTNNYVQHLHVMDEEIDNKIKLAIFLNEPVNYSFKSGDIIMVIDAYVNQDNVILNKDSRSITKLSDIWSSNFEIEDIAIKKRVSAIKEYFHDLGSLSVPEMHIKECLLKANINYVGLLVHKERELPNLLLLYFSDGNNNSFVVKAWGRYAILGNELLVDNKYFLYSVKILQVENALVGCFHESSNGYIMHVDEKHDWKLGIKNRCNCLKVKDEMNLLEGLKSIPFIVDMHNFDEIKKAIAGVYIVSFIVLEYYGYPLNSFYQKLFCVCCGKECEKCREISIDHYKIISSDTQKNKLVFFSKFIYNIEKSINIIALVAKDIVENQEIYTIVNIIDQK